MKDEKKFLKEYGYNMVKLPREDIEPLDFLLRYNKSLKFHCSFPDIVLETTGKKPKIRRNESFADFTGYFSRKLDFSLGIDFLKKYLSLIGAEGIGIDTCYKNSKYFIFTYSDIRRDSFATNDIDKYLRNATFDPYNIFIKDYDEKGESYLITSTLKSNKFTIAAYDEKDVTIDAEISGLNGILDAHPKFNGHFEKGTIITSKEEYYLKFAFEMIAVWANLKEKKFEVERNNIPSFPMKGLTIQIPTEFKYPEGTETDDKFAHALFEDEEFDLNYDSKK